MAAFKNDTVGVLVLADQRSIAPGAVVEISADRQKNVAVSRWIEEGKLVEQKPAKPAKTDDK